MRSRFAVAALPVALLVSALSYAQEPADVVIGLARDDYNTFVCGADGQTVLSGRQIDPDSHIPVLTVVGVPRDGLIVNFQLGEKSEPLTAASSGSDVFIFAHRAGDSDQRPEMFHFDSQANPLAQQRVDLGFHPQQTAVLGSGKIVVVGLQDAHDQEDWKFVGAVIDVDGRVLARFKFPLPPEGGGWTFESRRMLGGDDAAYMMLHSYDPQATGLARISEDGQIDIKIVPEPIYNEQRHHNSWTFGAGVAVEEYHYVGERSTFHFDEYDVDTGQRIASRYAFISGSRAGCYSRGEVSMLSNSAHVDPAQKLTRDTRLVFANLQDQQVSTPVVNPETCHCAVKAEQHP